MIPEERSDETVWPESQLIQFSISSSVLFARLPGLYRAPEGQQASLQKSTWTPLRIEAYGHFELSRWTAWAPRLPRTYMTQTIDQENTSLRNHSLEQLRGLMCAIKTPYFAIKTLPPLTPHHQGVYHPQLVFKHAGDHRGARFPCK